MSTAQRNKTKQKTKTASQHHRVSLRIKIQAAQAQHIFSACFRATLSTKPILWKIAPFVLSHLWTLPWPSAVSVVFLWSRRQQQQQPFCSLIQLHFAYIRRALQNGAPLNATTTTSPPLVRTYIKSFCGATAAPAPAIASFRFYNNVTIYKTRFQIHYLFFF